MTSYTAIWVLMMLGSHGQVHPTLTFRTEDQCLVALADMRVATAEEVKRRRLPYGAMTVNGFCTPVEGAR